MRADLHPLRTLLLVASGWVNRQQQDTIAYLVEENRVLKAQLKGRKLRLNDDQRRRLAALAKQLGRRTLNTIATIVTPDTLMKWHRQLIARKWTFEANKRVGRPGLMKKIAALIVRMATENAGWGYCRIQGELKDIGLAWR
jgi:putative transposase